MLINISRQDSWATFPIYSIRHPPIHHDKQVEEPCTETSIISHLLDWL